MIYDRNYLLKLNNMLRQLPFKQMGLTLSYSGDSLIITDHLGQPMPQLFANDYHCDHNVEQWEKQDQISGKDSIGEMFCGKENYEAWKRLKAEGKECRIKQVIDFETLKITTTVEEDVK